MRRAVLLLALALLPLAAPVASAASCSAVTQPYPDVQGEYAEPRVSGGTTYEVHWWDETNGVDGLQKSSCTGADGAYVPADTWTARTSVDLSGLVRVSGGCAILFGSWHVCLL